MTYSGKRFYRESEPPLTRNLDYVGKRLPEAEAFTQDFSACSIETDLPPGLHRNILVGAVAMVTCVALCPWFAGLVQGRSDVDTPPEQTNLTLIQENLPDQKGESSNTKKNVPTTPQP